MDFLWLKGVKALLLPFFMVLAPILFCPHTAACGGGTELVMLNVGEGLSVLLAGEEGRVILVDTGNPIAGPRIVKYLQRGGFGEVETIIITHPHPDHMGGIFAILGLLPVKRVYDNGQPIPRVPNCDILRWYNTYVRGKGNYGVLKRGDVVRVNEDARLEVLWPRSGKWTYSKNWNENSLILLAHIGTKRVLIMGDATKTVERTLMGEGLLAKVDGLVVGHHGADDATSMNFLRIVRPKWAYISVDKDNIRGYPGKRTISNLKAMGTVVLYSFAQGDCHLSLDNGMKCSGLPPVPSLH